MVDFDWERCQEERWGGAAGTRSAATARQESEGVAGQASPPPRRRHGGTQYCRTSLRLGGGVVLLWSLLVVMRGETSFAFLSRPPLRPSYLSEPLLGRGQLTTLPNECAVWSVGDCHPIQQRGIINIYDPSNISSFLSTGRIQKTECFPRPYAKMTKAKSGSGLSRKVSDNWFVFSPYRCFLWVLGLRWFQILKSVAAQLGPRFLMFEGKADSFLKGPGTEEQAKR